MKAKQIYLTFLILFFFVQSNIFSQIHQPVKWSFSSKRVSDDEAVLTFRAKIDNTWHLYGAYIPSGGPIATTFYYDTVLTDFAFDGKLVEPTGKTKYDKEFEMNLKMFDKEAIFTQKIKIKNPKAFKITGYVTFMCCDDSQCLPPTDEAFEFKFDKKSNASSTLDENANAVQDTAELISSDDTLTKNDSSSTESNLSNTIEKQNKEEEGGFLGIIIKGFLGGLLALLTPCVFPMIPMTVTFFLRSRKSRKKAIADAIIYGASIISIYVIIGLSITIIFGANALNSMATSPVFNTIFFLLLLIFSISFFGVFELQLPAKWTNALDSKADKTSGLLSIFLMAFTLVLISFSCTGPIIGTLLVDAATSGKMLSPLLGMAGFATALAIPFTLFAIFPSWLQSMPKSGGWLNAVKVVLAFVLLAFSLKFLSSADSVGQWNLLPREVFLALWIIIFTLLGFYLLGKIKFSHDTEMKHLPVSRLFLSIAVFTFVVYMLPGMFGAPLKLIGSFLPDISSQEFVLTQGGGAGDGVQEELPEGKKVKLGAHGLVKFLDYEEGMAYAKDKNKPVFLDFTGFGCTNCKKMENNVWSDKRVLKILKNDFVIIALYLDDITKLSESEQYISTVGNKERKIRTVGAKWSDFQAKTYGVNSQPYYVLLDNEGKKLVENAFTLSSDIEAFTSFLSKGKAQYEAGK